MSNHNKNFPAVTREQAQDATDTAGERAWGILGDSSSRKFDWENTYFANSNATSIPWLSIAQISKRRGQMILNSKGTNATTSLYW